MPQNIKNHITRSLELPADTLADHPLIYITANTVIKVENHKGILEFDSDSIKLASKLGIIQIIGKSLKINIINQNDIIVTGTIRSVNYCV